ncbi:MAG: alpha/beta hydrolase, partial [Dehalococcoidia bacterium]|nr:alpha/beta hydrolase [Dehalococcoidia bacterium]
MSISPVTFAADHLLLEGVLHLPEASTAVPAVVVCHPHPLYGGNMYNLVVTEICRCLVEREIAALRFNFRGTGASQGSYGEGVQEQADVRGALSYLASLEQVDPNRLGVAGYSFGAFVALAAGVTDQRAKALCGIAPPVTYVDLSFLKDSATPKFFIFGSRDEITPLDPFLDLYRQLQGENRYEVVQGTDHFLFGYEDGVA